MPDPNKSFSVGTQAPAVAPSAPAAPPTAAAAPPAAPAAGPESAPKDEPVEGTRFLLQAGAFKSAEDADGMRAQLGMIGLDSRIFPIDQGGQQMTWAVVVEREGADKPVCFAESLVRQFP